MFGPDRRETEDVRTQKIWHNGQCYTVTGGVVDLGGSLKFLCPALAVHAAMMLVFWGQLVPPFYTFSWAITSDKVAIYCFLAVLVASNGALFFAIKKRHPKIRQRVFQGKLLEVFCCVLLYGYLFFSGWFFVIVYVTPLLFWIPLGVVILVVVGASKRISFTFDPHNNPALYPPAE